MPARTKNGTTMGYHTEFSGHVTITPALNPYEVVYLRKFNNTRRMNRTLGPYFVDGSGYAGQGDDSDILDPNKPPHGQPELWCGWTPTTDGTAIEWDGGEKFYSSVDWMRYLIDTFLKPGAALQKELAAPIPGRDYHETFEHFTFDHVLNGAIHAQGEDHGDEWVLVVENNTVTQADVVRVIDYQPTPKALLP
ncbi:hypothetical protein [Actinomadura yumaensis]|uniref:Uncharacterized protein n=1 Tax=Actinomadura yumaensis TaxID=111807 RepID=A0ABW2CPA1_9ACTN